MITQKQLKEILHYNPETGYFTWLKSPEDMNVSIGSIAGYTHKNTNYCHIMISNKFNAAHRLAWLYMTGNFPINCIDHKNRVRCDNRWVNLCDATKHENSKNNKLSIKNTSGVSGVCWDKEQRKWRVTIGINMKKKCYGRYKNLDEAIEVRNKAYKELGFSPTHGLKV